MNYTITFSDMADPEAKETLASGIRAFNDAHSPHHRAIRGVGGTPLELYVRGSHGALLGGLAGETYWGWLYVDKLWLHESLRGRGIARDLMQRAEIEATRRDCRAAYLTTFSFQARGLYEKLGYRVVGQLDDYPPGSIYYWMRKDFHPDAGDHEL